MELDDLKKTWSEQQPTTGGDDRELVRQIIHRSHRGLRWNLWLEIALGIFTLVALVMMMVFFNERMSGFFYKLTIPLVLYAIPVYYRLYRSTQFLENMDFSGDVRSTLSQFLAYYTRTLRIYQWGAYAAIGVATVLLFTDPKFLTLGWDVKAKVLVYMVLVSILIAPLVKRFYSGKARAIREYLEEKE